MSNEVVPSTPVLQKRSYSSSMSYVGITRRTVAWAKRASGSAALAVLMWTLATLFLAVMYVFLIVWYFMVFVLFGIFTFPFRLMRRSQRKREHLAETQLATMQAMLKQQNQSGEI